jgi:hypothetical protein
MSLNIFSSEEVILYPPSRAKTLPRCQKIFFHPATIAYRRRLLNGNLVENYREKMARYDKVIHMKPLMNKREIAYFKKFLLQYGREGRTVRVLEWGSGGSTVYYTLFLRKHKIPYLWRSIEYNKGWYEKVRDMVKDDPSTKIELFDVENNALRQRTLPMNEYVDFPRTLNEKFDLIFVDGRKRRRCVLLARELISPDGVVLLHDAQRRHYQCAFKVYPNETFLSTHLWCGKTNEVTPFKKHMNKVRSWLYTKNYWYFVQPIQMLRGHAPIKISSDERLPQVRSYIAIKKTHAYFDRITCTEEKGYFNSVPHSIRNRTTEKDSRCISQRLRERSRIPC